MQKRNVEPERDHIAASLLAWYGRERRDLPWRVGPIETADPYRVWLSEIMLQQTTVKAVLPRYAAFVRQWPNVKALAAAELGQVLAAWAGLGYYARARNLHACARAVVTQHGGRFPQSAEALRVAWRRTLLVVVEIAVDRAALPPPAPYLRRPGAQCFFRIAARITPARPMAAHIDMARGRLPGSARRAGLTGRPRMGRRDPGMERAAD